MGAGLALVLAAGFQNCQSRGHSNSDSSLAESKGGGNYDGGNLATVTVYKCTGNLPGAFTLDVLEAGDAHFATFTYGTYTAEHLDVPGFSATTVYTSTLVGADTGGNSFSLEPSGAISVSFNGTSLHGQVTCQAM
jgi:hypothetical protein